MILLGGRRRVEQLIDSLRSEIAELRAENARLRSDEQRPLDPHAVAAELHDLSLAASLTGAADGGPNADSERQEMLDLQLVRQGLLEVCTRLHVLSGQLHRQLAEGTKAEHLDRRVTDLGHPRERRTEDRRADGLNMHLNWGNPSRGNAPDDKADPHLNLQPTHQRRGHP